MSPDRLAKIVADATVSAIMVIKEKKGKSDLHIICASTNRHLSRITCFKQFDNKR